MVVYMATIDELIYYCNEPEPIGALMLTGEWGCGKTFLVDNELPESLGDEFEVVRVSLFGVDSVETFTSKVKSAYLKAYFHVLGIDSDSKKVRAFSAVWDKAKNIFNRLPVPDELKNVISINVVDFIPITNNIGKKQVILVFDDLERSDMKESERLGCINEYCENRKFHTIVIANEDKINQEGVYSEIKEKIIERTVKYEPDYSKIIKAILQKFKTADEEYKQFLIANQEDLILLYFDDSHIRRNCNESVRPKNIRSFKCAIQDFYRIYQVLKECNEDNLSEWLLSFVAFELAYKANLLSTKEYGSLFWNQEIKSIYPYWYNEYYMLYTAQKWLIEGSWDEILLIEDLKRIKKRREVIQPEEIVRTCRLVEIDEDVLEQGFPVVLQKAYNGELTIDEYINLIGHSLNARQIGYSLPMRIIWSDVITGIKKSIEKMVQSGTENGNGRTFLGSETVDKLQNEEKSVYSFIEKWRNEGGLICAQNRNKFLAKLKENPIRAFSEYSSKRFNVFDEEMANLIYGAYRESNNSDKGVICEEVCRWWENCYTWQYIDLKASQNGFELLVELLKKDFEFSDEMNKGITSCITQRFISGVQVIIENIRTKNEQPKHQVNCELLGNTVESYMKHKK